MLYSTFRDTWTGWEKKKVRVKPVPGHRISMLIPAAILEYEARVKSGRNTHVDADVGGLYPYGLPIDGDFDEKVSISSYLGQAASVQGNYTLIQTSADEDNYKKGGQAFWCIRKPSNMPAAADAANWSVLFWNPYNEPVYLWYVNWYAWSLGNQELYLDDIRIGKVRIYDFYNANNITKMPVHRWMLPGSVLMTRWNIPGGIDPTTYNLLFFLSNKEYLEDVLPFRSLNPPMKLGDSPFLPKPFETTKGLPVPEPIPIDGKIPPYPIPPGGGWIVLPSTPRPVPLDITDRYGSQAGVMPVKVTKPKETRSVEGLVTPFGMVRKAGDAMGRERTSNSGINYNADTLNTTDVVAHSVWTGHGSKSIFLHAVTGNFTVQIFTLYNWLSGWAITDESTITVDEAETVNIDIEAREIQITATAATAATIEWEVTR